ncbi:uncharacterized protein LOC110386600 isoform X2 [Bombyx mori]|uniref:Uncharacterized protein n=1 Tax=Bombyx mori TaxID=7091 RepID=A0A8R2QVM0_BOMMO|nr:uncharacterized protein LOC110386600 isoform X1 [Bombyx mori]
MQHTENNPEASWLELARGGRKSVHVAVWQPAAVQEMCRHVVDDVVVSLTGLRFPSHCSVIRWRIYSWAIPWRRNSTLKGYEFSLLSWKKRKSRIFLVVQRDGPPTNTIDFSRIRNPFTHACIKVRGLRLYCKNLSTTVSSSLHLFKIKPIIDQLNGKFSELYNILPENVALDESCMWKGWLNINQFI